MIKNLKVAIALATISILTVSCNTEKQTQVHKQVIVTNNHKAQNSLDWQGKYSGNLKNIDTSSVEAELKLMKDNTFELTTTNTSYQPPVIDKAKGKIIWKENIVTLKGVKNVSNSFKVEENRLKQIKGDGTAISTLTKDGNAIVEDKRWKLVELLGKAIRGDSTSHYIIFHSQEGTIETKVNCNIIIRKYNITNELQIHISDGISTLIGCPDGLEEEYKKVLNMIDNLTTDGKTMSLNKAKMAPLARFELVSK